MKAGVSRSEGRRMSNVVNYGTFALCVKNLDIVAVKLTCNVMKYDTPRVFASLADISGMLRL